SLPGDQVRPDVALNTNGGFVVWQDNITDGSGIGVSARQVDSTLSGKLGIFRVNQTTTNNQENARVALLKNGGAAFAWQGGPVGQQHIYAAFVGSNNTFVSNTDILVSTNKNKFQITPDVAVLNNSNVVFVWASLNQAKSNSLEDVYARILSPVGKSVKGEFLVNQFTNYNQRSPVVTALSNGGFAVAWVSEQERSVVGGVGSGYVYAGQPISPSVDVYARLYDGSGNSMGNEFLVNTDLNPCASPAIAAASDGTFMITWSARDLANANNGLDIFARTFSNTGAGGAVFRVNSYLYGDQYAPTISSLGTDYMIAWTSLGQDGSSEGVYGQFLQSNGSLNGGEFLVNTTTAGHQIQPVVASDGNSQFIAVWSTFTSGTINYDLLAQRYINSADYLPPMNAPFVYAPFIISNGVYQPQLQVSWPPLLGIPISNYEVYVDGATTPMVATPNNIWKMTAADGLTTNSTHSFQLDYVTASGHKSPRSPVAVGATWSGANYYGIPYEWMEQYYGSDPANWPANVNAPLAPGGLSLAQVFLSGGDPTDSDTWLKTTLTNTPQGMFLSWNTQPGQTYQVQVTTDLTTWTNLGAPRFAAGDTDSIYVGGAPAGYYRVVFLRQ
ncbi:MAG TPA: hypothetical protein VHG89_09795, partial [Verrucomicrobiae bacterium]|nr:hypothetical protein [Verrucomicrobiae bacterium]